MANTGIRQLTTVVGGYAKRIWYSLNGTTPTNELMSIDDTGKLKCVSEQVTGLAGTGNRMVVADASGNLSANGEVTETIKAKGGILTNALGSAGNSSSAYIRSLNAYSTPTNPDYSFWYNDNVGIYHPSVDTLGVSTGGVGRALFNSSGLTLPNLAGTGNRMVVADASGNLSAWTYSKKTFITSAGIPVVIGDANDYRANSIYEITVVGITPALAGEYKKALVHSDSDGNLYVRNIISGGSGTITISIGGTGQFTITASISGDYIVLLNNV